MDNYINSYEKFTNKIVYDFNHGSGGIGDYIKFFMFALELCIKNNTRLYCKINNIEIEKYIKLKYNQMYVTENDIKKIDCVEIVTPVTYYHNINYNYSVNIKDVFFFTNEVKVNSERLFPLDINNYTSIHLRLGDKYLETEKIYILCKEDTRFFSEEKIYNFIEKNNDKKLFFCCDNNNYKLKIKEKYNNIIITNCSIGHSSLPNTTNKQVLDSVTEFYILTKSNTIFAASRSGFSIIAAQFNNIPLIN
jgi:hypothetical protein